MMIYQITHPLPQVVLTFCSQCKSTVEAATESASIAQGLNLGALILLIPPVAIFCVIFFVVIRGDKKSVTRNRT